MGFKFFRNLFAGLGAALLLTACITTSDLKMTDTSIEVPPYAKFTCVKIYDQSGFVTDKSVDNIDIRNEMQNAVNRKLTEYGIKGNGYTIDVTILDYMPGNALARTLVIPFVGETRLKINARIYDAQNRQIAEIPVFHSVNVDGGVVIGAYKKTFNDTAGELVAVINKELLKRQDPTK